jgi:hypothetical protein
MCKLYCIRKREANQTITWEMRQFGGVFLPPSIVFPSPYKNKRDMATF